ncbi:MAG: insulinase family protein [Ruminococcaceae bacterium]|nr:insulinase family protein [Oscillospiraceae bacterium]
MHHTITLPNGVRILTQPVPAVRTAAIGIFVGTGSRHETAAQSGAAHFLEHMAFKSTQHRTTDQLARQIDAMGGHMNAYTTKESTCFYARCLDTHLEQVIDLLCDMLFHSSFLPEEVDTERGVILEEIGMYKDTPEDLVAERLSAAVYKGHSLARPILGTKKTLDTMTGDWLRAYRREHYRPDRVVVSLAGSFSDAAVDELTSRFSALSGAPSPAIRPAVYQSAITTRRKAIEQNHLIVAFPSLSYLDEGRYAMHLMSSILGGGVSSRLFQEVREKRGLCYTVYSYIADHEDTGLLGLYTALSPDTERQALDTLCRVAADLAEHGPEQEELDRAREQAKSNILMSLESTQSRMSHMGTAMLLRGSVASVDEVIASYDAVTTHRVRALAQQVFDFGRASLSAVGKVGAAEDYRAVLDAFR